MSGNGWDMGNRPGGGQWYFFRMVDPFTALNPVTRRGGFSRKSLCAVFEMTIRLTARAWFGGKGSVDG